MTKYRRVFDFKALGYILIPLGITLLFWNTAWFSIFRMFVVMLHEYSHGLAALMTGGQISSLTFNMSEGGKALTSGGNFVIVASAGYVGSMLFGGILILLSKLKDISKYIILAIGVAIVLMTLLYVDNLFAILFSAVFVLIVGALAFFGGNGIASYCLKFLGVLSVFYTLYDLSALYLSNKENDAAILANATGIPAIIWSITWTVIAVTILYYLVLTKREKVEYY